MIPSQSKTYNVNAPKRQTTTAAKNSRVITKYLNTTKAATKKAVRHPIYDFLFSSSFSSW